MRANWTETREVDGLLRADRCDGAYIAKSGIYGIRRWRAHGPDSRVLCARLYADWEMETGQMRTFKTAKAAANAVDARWPLMERTHAAA